MMSRASLTVLTLTVLTACGVDAVGRLAQEGSPSEPAITGAAPAPAPSSSSSSSSSPSADAAAAGDDDAATAVPACADRALAFDGIDDFASVPDHRALDLAGDFTVEAWIKPGPRAATGDEMHVVSHHDQMMSRGWSLLVRARRVELVVWGSDAFGSMAYSAGNAGPEYVAAGKWMHVVGTLTAGMLRIYAGGVLRDAQLLGSDFVRQHDAHALTIGRPAFASAQFFDGIVDDVRLSTTARATGDTTPVPVGPLAADAQVVALYRFDETSGAAILDAAGAGVHGGALETGPQAPARVAVPCAAMR